MTVHKTHLCATVDGLTKIDMLLLLGAPVPVLACNALRVSMDTGLTCGEVAVGLDGIHGAALVGINPVETCKRKQMRTSKLSWTKVNSQYQVYWTCLSAELTTGPVRVAEPDVTAGAGRVLLGALR